MLKATAWSLLSGGLLAAGFAYVYARRANARQITGDRQRSLQDADTRSQALMEALAEPLPADDEQIEIELVDVDSLEEREESYDATSPDDLGALWLARATQTSGAHTSTSLGDEEFADEDDEVDPNGRPTEPPRQSLTAAQKEPR
jgi:hypothetical protein